jgi:predicted 2-oxoglutarate/Fe(II)-dependent dioxygenase YbiX
LVGEEQYEGGRLVFATSDGVLHAPRRQAGAVTVHNSSVVHGVTRHVRGVRYGLFFIKEGYDGSETETKAMTATGMDAGTAE